MTPSCKWPIANQGHVKNMPYVPFPLPSQSSSFSFPIYLSLQDDLSKALTAFQMAKILQLSEEILFLVELNVS